MTENGSAEPKRAMKEHASVTVFRNYLRINTVHPDPDYEPCVDFLLEQAKLIGLASKVTVVHPKKPVVVLTWEGLEPKEKSLFLNSHTDVVPFVESCWKYPPFSAHKDEKGDIYARGSQDMKCVGIQYLEAVRRLKAGGKRFKRTIHLCYVPDEEISGDFGMKLFVKHPDFLKLNVGCAMDEGVASPTDDYLVYNSERSIWWVEVTCPGTPGHGSKLLKNTAASKMIKVINTFLAFRDEQEKLLDSGTDLGEVISINWTMATGGVQYNVVPSHMTAGFDMRFPPTVDLNKMEMQIGKWCKEAGDDVTFKFVTKNINQEITPFDETNPWWLAFKRSADRQKLKLKKHVFYGGTDSRQVRKLGLPAIGFSPMINTPSLLHDHNEFLNEDVFLRGIDIYCDIIPEMAQV